MMDIGKTMDTQLSGHSMRQHAQFQHSSGYFTTATPLSLSMYMMSPGQLTSHAPHPVHRSSSITAVMSRTPYNSNGGRKLISTPSPFFVWMMLLCHSSRVSGKSPR